MAELLSGISVRFSKEEKTLLDSYAKFHGKKQSDIIREAAMQLIEDDIDFRLFEEAKQKTTCYYSLKEARKELDLESTII
jgi:predicted DNA-binding protein